MQASDFAEINQAILLLCVEECAKRSFTGDLVYRLCDEQLLWSYNSILPAGDVGKRATEEDPAALASVEKYAPEFRKWVPGAGKTKLTVHMKRGLITRADVQGGHSSN